VEAGELRLGHERALTAKISGGDVASLIALLHAFISSSESVV
jgi:hypothetical protein